MRALAAALALWAGAAAGESVSAVEATYLCAGGAVLRAVYLNAQGGPSMAVIDWAGRLSALEIAPSASGALYVDLDEARSLRWHTKGDEGLLEQGGERLMSDCVALAR
jgi:membrane-bound inhibitor of C-type lysozyme